MESKHGSISVLMVPWLAHGHISPFLELAKKVTDRSNISIYLCSTPINLTSIKNKLPEKYHHSIHLVELHLPYMPHLPPHYHTTTGLPPHLMPTLKIAFEKSAPTFTTLLQTLNPNLIVYDFNNPWAPAAAFPLGIPAVQFSIFGAVFISSALHFIENPNIDYPFKEIYLDEHEKTNLQKLLDFSADGVKADKDLFCEGLKQSCDVVWIKTSREIEGKYIDYLSKLVKKKVQPVGPLVQDLANEEDGDGDREIMQWLEKKDESSVVFVSFGSEYFLSSEEREEIAHGLELSKVGFIWVVRFPVGEEIRVEEALPKGFIERVGKRGMIVEGWAPQAKILGHKSIGGFVSHCGWGSVLESMKFGIPIIAMPMHIDQPLNARLVEEVGVGVEVKRDKSGRFGREEIARVVKEIVLDKTGILDVRNKAKELSDKIGMKKEEEIDEVIEDIIQLCGKRI